MVPTGFKASGTLRVKGQTLTAKQSSRYRQRDYAIVNPSLLKEKIAKTIDVNWMSLYNNPKGLILMVAKSLVALLSSCYSHCRRSYRMETDRLKNGCQCNHRKSRG